MGHHLLSPFRQGLNLVLIALFAGSGINGCGMAGPSPQSGKPASAGAPGSAPGAGRGANDGKQADSTHLVLRLAERRLYLVQDGSEAPVESFPVAIGKEGWETPTGHFQVEEMIEHPDFLKVDDSIVPVRVIKRIPPGPTNPLGERWIQFAHGEGWTMGFHGTPNPELLGRAVSHGCVRMRNADVVRVYERVHLGTPVTVEP
jgi:lipoprotein-anchoring transpeptidase ErfK/SrfK